MGGAAAKKSPAASDPLSRALEAERYLVLDGGLATELERRGADLSDRLWSARVLIDEPALIREVHLDYFEAGADVATTASYQADPRALERRGLSPAEAFETIVRSVRLAQEARDRFLVGAGPERGRIRPLIAGSIGPYGAALANGSEYRGGYRVSGSDLRDYHVPRLTALCQGGVDLLAIETMPAASEVLMILAELEAWPHLPAWVSFTSRDSAHVAEGQPIGEAVRSVAGHPQVAAVGFNCVPPRLVADLLIAAGEVTGKPLVAYPNSGERWDPVRRAWSGEKDRDDLALLAPHWYDLGARLIGGCCRTTPATVRALRTALDAHAERSSR